MSRELIVADLGSVAPTVEADRLGAVADDLVDRHGRPARHHHTLEHARAVRDDVDRWGAAAGLDDETIAVVRLAAWFHDVVHTGVSGEDERASADVLAGALAALCRPDLVPVARDLVLVTITHQPTTTAEAVLVDADLGVLAGSAEVYERYRRGVRAEYAHVDDASWRTGRAAVLRELLDRPALFHGPVAAEREPAARANLEAELESLR